MADATTHVLGPGNAELRVLTEREGLASRAGHDLVLVVGRWEATLVLGDDAGLELTADSRSLEVKSASGGVKPVSDKDRREIVKNIDTKVLHGAAIVYRANTITDQPGEGLTVAGDLTIGGTSKPTTFELRLSDDGALSARAVITQTAFDLKPYSGLMGTLKVADDVVIEVEGRLP